MGKDQGKKEAERFFGLALEKIDGGVDVGIIAMVSQRSVTGFVEKAVVVWVVKLVWVGTKHHLAMRTRLGHTVGKAGGR